MANPKMRLGKFIQEENGTLHGRINGLGIRSVDVLSEAASSQEGRPYLRLIADPLGDAYDVGAAFPKEKDGMHYYSVNLDSPLLPSPISAALFPDRCEEHGFNLVWSRQEQDTNPSVAAKTRHDEKVAPEGERKIQSRHRYAAGMTP